MSAMLFIIGVLWVPIFFAYAPWLARWAVARDKSEGCEDDEFGTGAIVYFSTAILPPFPLILLGLLLR